MPAAVRLLALLVGLLLLGGCASPAPAGSPSSGAIASSLPPMPAETQAPDEGGAAALVTHFGDLLQHAAASGDTSALTAFADDGCAGCRSIRQDLEQTWQAGGREEGGELHVLATESLPAVGGRVRVAVFALHDASTRVIQDGSVTRVISRDAGQWEIHLMWTDAGWRIMTITHGSPQLSEALRTAQPGTVTKGVRH